jgi:hypothetical protein
VAHLPIRFLVRPWQLEPLKADALEHELMLLPVTMGLCMEGYVREWWKARDLKNVLLLHYNDAIKDLPNTVRRLAQFYEIDLTDEQVQSIAHQASFANMKANTASSFNYLLWGNPAFHSGTGTIIQDGKIFRSVCCAANHCVLSSAHTCPPNFFERTI